MTRRGLPPPTTVPRRTWATWRRSWLGWISALCPRRHVDGLHQRSLLRDSPSRARGGLRGGRCRTRCPRGGRDTHRRVPRADARSPVARRLRGARAPLQPRRDPDLLRWSLLHNLRRLADARLAWKTDPGLRVDPAVLVRRLETLWGDLHHVRCPTLVVRGAESDVFLDEDAERFAGAFARWPLGAG